MGSTTLTRTGPAGAALAAVAIGWSAGQSPAAAQTFPDDDAFVALPCGAGVMSDEYRDEPGASGPRDLVGNNSAPCGLRASDGQFFFLRLRLDQTPAMGTGLVPFAWGLEIDLDADTSTYEVLVLVDGQGGQVLIYQNTVTTLPDDPNDPADEPAVAVHPSASHTRVVQLTDSSYGDNPDFALDVAVPWSDLQPLGLAPTTPVFVWAASSTVTTSLNSDFACHDGKNGEPSLSDAAGDRTVIDPLVDSDGDGLTDAQETEAGSDPNDPNSVPDKVASGQVRLEGGGGCAAAGGSSWPLGLLVFALTLLLARRGRRRTS
jgi:hypothetical protein